MQENGINVLSLFDGISCGMIALKRAKIKVNNYYASEIDKYAIQVSKNNFPSIIHLGDVTKWREWDIDWSSIDMLIGGSPCQGFSLSGKLKNVQDSRSGLIFQYVDILNHLRKYNPNIKFMLENVKMQCKWENIISKLLGVQPVVINSVLVSAQIRKRNYWINWIFDQPIDKGIVLRDILEDTPNVDQEVIGCATRGRYNANKKVEQRVEINHLSKSNCLTTVRKDSMVMIDRKLRHLTSVERERLQTLPDNYTACCSDHQRTKQTGNGWTVDVIAHIFSYLKF